MTTITLEPAGKATYKFSVDGPAPPGVLATEPSISWRTRVHSISAIPAQVASARFSSGDKVRDAEGSISFSIGTATPQGKVSYDDDPIWGYLSAPSPRELRAGMHVSPDTLSRLLELVSKGSVPLVTLQLARTNAFRISNVDGRLDVWDEGLAPDVVVEWIEFSVQF